MQSTLFRSAAGLHVGIIMDGNGRWAAARGWPRIAGHKEGAKAVRRVVEAAPSLGVNTLTLYAFSSDNWQRPPAEVDALMRLLRRFLQSETANCVSKGVRLGFIGRRDRLDDNLVIAMESGEYATRKGSVLNLRIAVDYSAKESIVQAAQALNGQITCEGLSTALAKLNGLNGNSGSRAEVDMIIRTGGEQRLSDFLLWEAAYAELYFTPRMWPEFGKSDLEEALNAFHSRERRFGKVNTFSVS
jgi:undecaprenyl diphosphate synthase